MENCAGCLVRKRNPDKPAVAMPMAHGFNEKLAIDLKVWDKSENIYLLYMVDMWSRLTQEQETPSSGRQDIAELGDWLQQPTNGQ